MGHRTRLTVLISGNGSNLQAILDATTSQPLANAQVVRVISNKKTAYGLERARKADVPTAYHNLIAGGYTRSHPQSDPSQKGATQEARAAYDGDLASLILADKPDLVVCAGWMHVLSPRFLQPLEEAKLPIINLHPALPGEYSGASAIERAYDDFKAGKTERTGCMIHYVIQEVDMGEPICTRTVTFKPDESLDDFETRMHAAEHVLIVEGTQKAITSLNSH